MDTRTNLGMEYKAHILLDIALMGSVSFLNVETVTETDGSSILFPVWHRPYLALFEVRVLTGKTESFLTISANHLGKCSEYCCDIPIDATKHVSSRSNESQTTLLGLGIEFYHAGRSESRKDHYQYSCRISIHQQSFVQLQLPSTTVYFTVSTERLSFQIL